MDQMKFRKNLPNQVNHWVQFWNEPENCWTTMAHEGEWSYDTALKVYDQEKLNYTFNGVVKARIIRQLSQTAEYVEERIDYAVQGKLFEGGK